MKKHIDTVIIVSTIVGAALWMNTKFRDLQQEVAIIKTVLLMKGIYPSELVVKEKEK